MVKVMDKGEKARKATVISFVINSILSIGKFAVGVLGKSGAMVADAIHSMSDLVTDVIVFISLKINQKPADAKHNYGHGKVETVATVLVSIALFIAGFSIGRDGLEDLIGFFKGEISGSPALIVVIVAAASMIVKEILFRYTIFMGKSIGSDILIANAWHHRSDALSSLGVLIGVGGAYILGSKFSFLDSVAQIIVCLFIFRAAYKILIPNLSQLADAAIDEDEIEKIKNMLDNNEHIRDYHHLRTRHVGSLHAVDVHILVNQMLNISDAHDISSIIECEIHNLLGEECFVSIHIEPYNDEERLDAQDK